MTAMPRLPAGLDDLKLGRSFNKGGGWSAFGGLILTLPLVGDGAFWVLVPAGILVVVRREASRTFTTENMPPISIGPNWAKPVIIGSVLSGSGISI